MIAASNRKPSQKGKPDQYPQDEERADSREEGWALRNCSNIEEMNIWNMYMPKSWLLTKAGAAKLSDFSMRP